MRPATKRALLVAAALLAGACKPTPTSLDVTVTFLDPTLMPTALTISVTQGGTALLSDARLAGHDGAVVSGDTFLVLLPDSVDGRQVTVTVTTVGGKIVTGMSTAAAIENTAATVTVDLGEAPDGGVEHHDLAVRDEGHALDLAAPPVCHLGLPDAGGGCTASCSASTSMATACTPAGATQRTCAFGCLGTGCSGSTCASASMTPSTTSTVMLSDSTVGNPDNAAGSCGGCGAPESVVDFTLASWSSVVLDDTGSPSETVLYARSTCGDALSEIPLQSPCAGGATTPITACTIGGGELALCNLPPGTYSAFLDGKLPDGAAWKLAITPGPTPDLNSCAGAGNLLTGGTYMFSTSGNKNHFSTTMATCAPGDQGANAPDAAFFFALTAPHKVTLSTAGSSIPHLIYVRSQCGGPDLGCAATSGATSTTLTFGSLPPGLYYVIVDGRGDNPGGAITLKLTLE